MITLFRRIRQNLIDSGSITKYMIYAVGEILLVVIGILIALQINNWNEHRKDRSLEKQYLTNLKMDLQSDSLTLAEFKQRSDEQVVNKNKLTEYYRGRDFPVDSLIYFFEDQWKNRYHFKPITTTLDEMKSTGKLNVIRNSTLRRNILETYNYYLEFEGIAQTIYDEQLNKNWELYYSTIPGLYSLSSDENYDIKSALNSYEVENRLAGNFVVGMNNNLNDMIKVNTDILLQIRNELIKIL